ncbi:MAG: YraN family protein [Flavobacterium sp.]|nr:YraN family protein [Pedobacter sp.]
MAQNRSFGDKGEQLAKAYLEKAGYEILDLNWTFGKAEIDIIAYINKQIIFVEVKTRSSDSFGNPEDFVMMPKQSQMAYAADEYIFLMEHQGEVRFDVISILFNKQGEHVLNHIEDAFWP